MRTTWLSSGSRPHGGCIAVLGTFDGVHRGHRRLVAAAHSAAIAKGLPTTVVTFDRHPALTLRPDAAPPQLMTLRQKVAAFAALSAVDELLVVPFDKARSEQTAENFVEEVLVDELNVRAVVVGQNFRFGAGRRGDLALLRALGEQHGFELIDPPLLIASETERPCSSTSIRQLVHRGDLSAASLLLGRPVEIECEALSTVDTGARIELRPPARQCLPPIGAYNSSLRWISQRCRTTEAQVKISRSEEDGQAVLSATVAPGRTGRGECVVVSLRQPVGTAAGVPLHSRRQAQ